MWAAVFFDTEGRPLTSDHYSGLDASDSWIVQEFYFRARHDAKTCQLWFHPLEPSSADLCLSSVRVARATRAEVARWADRVYAQLPPLKFTPPADRGARLPRTREALRTGRPLRVVMLGDSIINDTSNSAWEVLLERTCPKARIEIVTSVRGGTGCQYYRLENRVQEYVLRHKPDLLIIGGISNGFDVEAMRSVIHQVRRQNASVEILVLSDPVGVHGDPRAWPLMIVEPGEAGDETRKRLAALGPYREGLREMAAEEAVEYFDVATIWDTYIAHCGRPYDDFLRDPVHANERGRQVLARMLVGFFAPAGR
jgi:lysophospholipase L1-like esterase